MASIALACSAGGCGLSLGSYEAFRDFEAASMRGILRLAARKLPRNMIQWDGSGERPRVYFRIDHGGYREGEIGPYVMQVSVPKYWWRCGCGAAAAYRADTLALRLPPGRSEGFL